MQDTTFENIQAVNIFWSLDGIVVADGLTYSNMTTEGNQWDSTGDVVGSGDGIRVVQQYLGPLEKPSTASALKKPRIQHCASAL
eukprot:jgi/Ulvmu1/6143/UM277_0002.1